jgi:hypothetical protein
LSLAFEPEHGFFASFGGRIAIDGKSVGAFFDQAPGQPVSGGAGGQSPGTAHGIAGRSGTEARLRLLVPDAPRPAPARRDREHDETEPNHHHSHEFESKGVHGNSPR